MNISGARKGIIDDVRWGLALWGMRGKSEL